MLYLKFVELLSLLVFKLIFIISLKLKLITNNDFRYQIGDFSGQILNEVSALRHIRPPSYIPLNNVQLIKFNDKSTSRSRVR